MRIYYRLSCVGKKQFFIEKGALAEPRYCVDIDPETLTPEERGRLYDCLIIEDDIWLAKGFSSIVGPLVCELDVLIRDEKELMETVDKIHEYRQKKYNEVRRNNK